MSDLKLPPATAAAYYGHSAGVLRGQRDNGAYESEEGEEEAGETASMAPYASSGKSAKHHHHHHHDADDGLIEQQQQHAPTRWNPKAGGETHHLRVKYEVKARRGDLSNVSAIEAIPTESVATRLRMKHAIEAFAPHTHSRLDEHMPKSQLRQPKNFDFHNVAVLGIELLSAQTNALQTVGAVFPNIVWGNTERHHQSAQGFAFTLTGDPNGRGQGQRITETQTIIDNSELHDSVLYDEFGDISIDDLNSRQLKVYTDSEGSTFDVLANSDLYRVTRSRQNKFADHDKPYDIEGVYRSQQRRAIEKGKTPSEYVRDVPDYIVLPIVELMKTARPQVRTINVETDLTVVLEAIGANSIESLEGTFFERLAKRSGGGQDGRVTDLLDETSVTAFELCFHYMLRNPERTVEARLQKTGARPVRRELTEEEVRELLERGAR